MLALPVRERCSEWNRLEEQTLVKNVLGLNLVNGWRLFTSSITSALILEYRNPGVFCKWSSSRPGVALVERVSRKRLRELLRARQIEYIMRLIPFAIFSASARLFAPPMMIPYV